MKSTPSRYSMIGGLQQHFGSAPTMGFSTTLPNLAANGLGSAQNIGNTTNLMAAGLAAFPNLNQFGAGLSGQNWQQALAQAKFPSLNASSGYLPHVGMSSQEPNYVFGRDHVLLFTYGGLSLYMSIALVKNPTRKRIFMHGWSELQSPE